MKEYLFNVLVTLVAFISMEGVAWLTHKYIMHGILWVLHRDHHQKESSGFFERNDLFFLIFAIPGVLGLILGLNGNSSLFFTGLGITFYGMAYFLVHEIFIHRRFDFLKRSDSVYLRSIRKAHKVHHKHLGKENGECFGMLWVPVKYFREAKRSR